MSNNHLHAWDRVLLARHPKRPTAKKLITELFPDFLELHGDRLYRDDPAFVCGLATINSQAITIIAEEKGSTTSEKITRNFGMPHPEGYRKAIRLVKQAEKFNRPVLFIIDTPGAYPGIGAEERGQAMAIANSLSELSQVKVPLIALVLSEGGSGGALAIGVADQIWMFENAVYSILSPEGFASILYKDASKAKEAAEVMKLTADELFRFKIIDKVILEPGHGLHESYKEAFKEFQSLLIEELKIQQSLTVNVRLERRYQKFRAIGAVTSKK
jgi:acetyl-CoA carboxylase carboxyl transferase subunit alpha